MFWDFKDAVQDYEKDSEEWKAKGASNLDEKSKKHEEFTRNWQGEWRRIKRPVYSKFWRAVHNMVAHPMLVIHRPTGQKLHDWTAEKMYESPEKGTKPISQTD